MFKGLPWENLPFNVVATTHFGLEQVLQRELHGLGFEDIKILNRAVSFKTDLPGLYKANYCSRLALRFLVPVLEAEVSNAQQLFDVVNAFPWWTVFKVDKTFAIESKVNQVEWVDNSQFVSLKVKDAIVDAFRDETGKRPSVNKEKTDVGIVVHLFKERLVISLDSTGASLHLRGYRTEGHLAPVNEVLAAGIIAISGWDKKSELIDFMCGSGTLLIEAAGMARQIPPGIIPRKYCFMHWNGFDFPAFEKVKAAALENIKEYCPPISGCDISFGAVKAARAHLKACQLEENVRIQPSDFTEKKPVFENGFVICNPPYGDRLNEDNIKALYKKMGDHLKQNFPGYEAWIFTGSPEGMRSIGLHPRRKIELYNGPIECRLLKYELYSGTKKIGKKPIIREDED